MLCMAAIGLQAAAGQSNVPFGFADKAGAPKAVPVVAVTSAAPMTVDQALATFSEYQAAMLNNDVEYLVSTLIDPERTEAIEAIQERQSINYIGLNKPLISWETDCAACWEDDTEGHICAITEERPFPHRDGVARFSNVFLLKNQDGASYIFRRQGVNGKSWRRLRKKMKKSNRVCDLENRTIHLNAPPSIPSTQDGARKMLRGIGAVLKELQ